jgi:glycosyltransferase involved in cell wall biosynthesis
MLAIYAAAARAAGIDRVIAHSHCTGKNDLRHAVSRLATVPILQKCASDFCACSEEAGRWRFSHAVCDSRLKVIKNGIDPVAYAFDGNKRELIRSAYGVPDDAVLIGIFGRLSYQKNQLYMLRLLRRILDSREASDCGAHDFRIEDHTRYMLMFAGGGEDLAMLQTHARMMGLEDRVIFAGAAVNISDYYSAADVIAVPSQYEGLPLVVLEAQAAGLEVIASEAVPRIADATGLVRFIPLDDREGWAEALTTEHMRHRGTAAEIRGRGYSADETAGTIRSLYKSE